MRVVGSIIRLASRAHFWWLLLWLCYCCGAAMMDLQALELQDLRAKQNAKDYMTSSCRWGGLLLSQTPIINTCFYFVWCGCSCRDVAMEGLTEQLASDATACNDFAKEIPIRYQSALLLSFSESTL